MQISTSTLLLLLAAAIYTSAVAAATGSQQLRVTKAAEEEAPVEELLKHERHNRALNPVSRLCLAGTSTRCLCTEDALRSAVLAATASGDSSTKRRPSIRICSGTGTFVLHINAVRESDMIL